MAKKDHLKVELLDIDAFVKDNNLKEITNPIFFNQNNTPTPDGLLSNEIFGITKDSRATTFAYINLHGYFLTPLAYKIWQRIDSKITSCVYGTETFKIQDGRLVPDPDGGTGLDFLRENFDKFEFQKNNSRIRNKNIDFLLKYKDRLFIKNFIVIPAFYRDISTTDKYVGVGDINKLYNNILIATRSLIEYEDYGLSIGDSIKGRIQDNLANLYEYFSKDTISGKFGLIRNAASSKTSDYSARLVISSPNLRTETIEEFNVDLDHCALPLASTITNFYPFVVTYIKNFFTVQLQNMSVIPYYQKDKDGNIAKEPIYLTPKDYRIAFSDDVIHSEIDRFIHGFSDRFRPIKVPVMPNKYKIDEVEMRFVGFTVPKSDLVAKLERGQNISEGLLPVSSRSMTWCDLFYIAAVDVTRDKAVLITRYPIDSCYNQFPSLINVNSTVKTEPMVINGKFYKTYPRIRKEDIGVNTSNLFIDTLQISNVYLGSIGGDYDGDQVTVKGIYSTDANKEVRDFLQSKNRYISFGQKNIMKTTNEGAIALYSLTLDLEKPGTFTEPEFKY